MKVIVFLRRFGSDLGVFYKMYDVVVIIHLVLLKGRCSVLNP